MLKTEKTRWEPGKALITAFAAGVAVAALLFTLALWLVAHVH